MGDSNETNELSELKSYDSNNSLATTLSGQPEYRENGQSTRNGGRPRKQRNTTVDTYVPQKRLSRYKPAAASMKPIRLKYISKTELPLDDIGLFSNITSFWIRKFRITRSDSNNVNLIPQNSTEISNSEKIQIPTVSKLDDCTTNRKRFLGIYKDLQCMGGKKTSMFSVARKFCLTRTIISSIFYTLAIIIEILGTVR